ncbi:hypothetical protein ASPFODRAFT_47475 [Aspergillus luchuensis CBS 106.47]|uniref:Uncharacterized protein n=1 Tax=Aspergillus luchuensis (strain CBS 106.47) TaxID=1137211 RepID=A0A1M3TDT7_ASPLC|nr:hypothetical protein ASPFODRAFT_47475 [Aspergillus luchuensis CBS 106.47]
MDLMGKRRNRVSQSQMSPVNRPDEELLCDPRFRCFGFFLSSDVSLLLSSGFPLFSFYLFFLFGARLLRGLGLVTLNQDQPAVVQSWRTEGTDWVPSVFRSNVNRFPLAVDYK